MGAILHDAPDSLSRHWPEYLIEAVLLGTFMVVACTVVAAVCHPRSMIGRSISGAFQRRLLIAVLMGLTAIALIYSPLGQRSGAHMNPGVTLTFFVLGKVKGWDAVFYICAQFLGGFFGVQIARVCLRGIVAHPAVNHAATLPGKHGLLAAWLGEFAIGLVMMATVLGVSNHAGLSAYTGFFAGLLVMLFITFEAPLSGMSLNPARSLGSAIPARAFRGLWIYFTAPPAGMLCAAGLYTLIAGSAGVYCAKLNHSGDARCIFNCGIDRMPGRAAPSAVHSGAAPEGARASEPVISPAPAPAPPPTQAPAP